MAKRKRRKPSGGKQPPQTGGRPSVPLYRRRAVPWIAAAVLAAIAAAVVVVVVTQQGGSGSETEPAAGGTEPAAGLPNTPDYHSLLVDPADPEKVTLGTHAGLYTSSDGGRHWRFTALSGNDAMNLARPGRRTVWLAGHEVFKKSTDGGASWSDVQTSGLPSLDIHGFAVDPRNPKALYAAIAGQGLYRSGNGGRSFSPLSKQVGPNVMALAVLPDGRILAADMQQGLLESADAGAHWKRMLRAQLMGLAVNPSNPKRLLATGAGIALSTNGGRRWRAVLDLPGGVGPVVWAPGKPNLAYAVGLNRTFYRSTDGGESWHPVEAS